MPFFNRKIDCTPSTQESLYKNSSLNITNKKETRPRHVSEARPDLKINPAVMNTIPDLESVKNSDTHSKKAQDKVSLKIEQIDNDVLDTFVPAITGVPPIGGTLRFQQSEAAVHDNQISPQKVIAYQSQMSNHQQNGEKSNRYRHNKHLNYHQQNQQLPQIQINAMNTSQYASPNNSGANSQLRSTLYKNLYNNQYTT